MEPDPAEDLELSEERFSYQKAAEQEMREAGACTAAPLRRLRLDAALQARQRAH
jgi:hypothetical protein